MQQNGLKIIGLLKNLEYKILENISCLDRPGDGRFEGINFKEHWEKK